MAAKQAVDTIARAGRGPFIALLALATSACATVGGSQALVRAPEEYIREASTFGEQAALEHYATLPVERRAEYRDKVIAIHLSAIEARYWQFRTHLSREIKTTSLVSDGLVLGLTGIGAVANGAANELSAAAAAITGARASINRELYFERTLPALLSAMEANRLRVKTRILTAQQAGADQYSLARAFGDLTELALAGSLDGAIQEVTEEASADAAGAKRDYEAVAVNACNATAEISASWRDFNRAVRELGADRQANAAAIAATAEAMGITPDELFNFQRRTAVLNTEFCTPEEAAGLAGQVAAARGGAQ